MNTTVEKILVRGVNWLGDAVMSTPALQRLREAKPGAEIVLMTPEKLADLWNGHPAVDRVLAFFSGESVLAIARRLRSERFGTALVFPNSPRSALEVFLAGIPVRVGYARTWRRWMLTRRIAPRADEVRMHKRTPAEVRDLVRGGSRPEPVPIQAGSHHLFQYLHLAAALGAKEDAAAPHVAVSADEVAAVRRRFGADVDGGVRRRLIGINPGAEYGPAKRWPAERFVAAAVELGRVLDARLWVLGGPSDRELAASIAAGIRARGRGLAEDRVRCLAGETSLRELCAVLKACDVVLTNDTGPMHVAAAVGTPVVVPFGSTSWRMTGPGLPGETRHRFLESAAPCSPCFRRECPIDLRCMTGITVEQVVDGVVAALG